MWFSISLFWTKWDFFYLQMKILQLVCIFMWFYLLNFPPYFLPFLPIVKTKHHFNHKILKFSLSITKIIPTLCSLIMNRWAVYCYIFRLISWVEMRMSRLTCLACQVGFTDAELHRVHFKGIMTKYVMDSEPQQTRFTWFWIHVCCFLLRIW